MHITVLSQSHLDLFMVEHEDRIREGNRQRMLAQARAAEKQNQVKVEPRRGFIPRVVGALGLF